MMNTCFFLLLTTLVYIDGLTLRVVDKDPPKLESSLSLPNLSKLPLSSLKQGSLKEFPNFIRNRRNVENAFLPYSTSSHLSRSTRYRYPLYRKRTNRNNPLVNYDRDWQSSSDYDSFMPINENANIISELIKNQKDNSIHLDDERSPLLTYNNDFERSFRTKRSKDQIQNGVENFEKESSQPEQMPSPNQNSDISISKAIPSNTSESDSKSDSESGFASKFRSEKRQKRAEEGMLDSDNLARKYFGILSQSYGEIQKRKFGDLEEGSDYSLENLIANPTEILYLKHLIMEAEKNIANGVEEQLNEQINGRFPAEVSDEIFTDAVARLTLLEKMKDNLAKLELQVFMDKVYKRGQNLATESSSDFEKVFEKRRKSPRFYQIVESNLRKKSENTREECPVFERIVLNCAALTKLTNDEQNLFLESCIRHEICYMCGASMDASQSQCDAIFSSSLNLECAGNSVDEENVERCLQRGEESLKALMDPTRFDPKGSCTYDPCVRQLLEAR